jgi:adenylate kinase
MNMVQNELHISHVLLNYGWQMIHSQKKKNGWQMRLMRLQGEVSDEAMGCRWRKMQGNTILSVATLVNKFIM